MNYVEFRSGRRRGVKIVLLAFFVLVASALLLRLRSHVEIPAYPDEHVLRSAVLEGVTYKLADDGNIFRVIDERGTWTHVDRIFDPTELATIFAREGDSVFRVDTETGKRYLMLKHFEDGFEGTPEGVSGLRSLICEERKWTEFTLQTHRTPNIPDYVQLRKEILQENADFLDATVAPSQRQAHSGKQSLCCFCPPKSYSMVCAKASIGTSFIYFEEGDELWFQAWYRIDGPTAPFTLADIEGRQVKESPGIRLMMFEGNELGVELKALEKPKYRQKPGQVVRFPTDQWVKVTWHVTLHPDQGKVQVWQDDQLIVDSSGSTLPFSGMIYDSLEVGITAHSFGNKPATLYIDDMVITTKPLIGVE